MIGESVKWVGELIASLQLTEVQRERFKLAEDRINALVRECAELKEQRAQKDQTIEHLEKKCREYENQIGKNKAAEEFVEERGVLFKRKSAGGFHEVPFCPVCRCSLSSLEGFLPYMCSRCRFSADFSGNDLKGILLMLPQ